MENLGKSYEKCYKEHEIIGFNNKFGKNSAMVTQIFFF